MIAYEELERALARWKGRSQGGGGAVAEEASAPLPVAAAPEAPVPSEMMEGDPTPLPIRAEDLGSLPLPEEDRTGEVDASQIDSERAASDQDDDEDTVTR